MSGEKRTQPSTETQDDTLQTLILVVEPERRDLGNPPKRFRFEARLDGRLVCTSDKPFLDAARVLLAEGVDPSTRLEMRAADGDFVLLTGTVGAAARLTILEGDRLPRFAVFKPYAGVDE